MTLGRHQKFIYLRISVYLIILISFQYLKISQVSLCDAIRNHAVATYVTYNVLQPV